MSYYYYCVFLTLFLFDMFVIILLVICITNNAPQIFKAIKVHISNDDVCMAIAYSQILC